MLFPFCSNYLVFHHWMASQNKNAWFHQFRFRSLPSTKWFKIRQILCTWMTHLLWIFMLSLTYFLCYCFRFLFFVERVSINFKSFVWFSSHFFYFFLNWPKTKLKNLKFLINLKWYEIFTLDRDVFHDLFLLRNWYELISVWHGKSRYEQWVIDKLIKLFVNRQFPGSQFTNLCFVTIEIVSNFMFWIWCHFWIDVIPQLLSYLLSVFKKYWVRFAEYGDSPWFCNSGCRKVVLEGYTI